VAARGQKQNKNTPPAWCSLRLRFEDPQLGLLRSAEQLYGALLARGVKRDTLRDALALAKLGKRLAAATAGEMLVLSESEVKLLVVALRASLAEIHAVSALGAGGDASERAARLREAFPELSDRMWRAFGVSRELEALTRQIEAAVSPR